MVGDEGGGTVVEELVDGLGVHDSIVAFPEADGLAMAEERVLASREFHVVGPVLFGEDNAAVTEFDEVVDGVLPHLERFEGKGRVTPAQLAATPPPAAARTVVARPAAPAP